MAAMLRRKVIRWGLLGFLLFTVVGGAIQSLAWWRNHELAQLSRQCRAARVNQDWKKLATVAEQWTQQQPDSGEAWVVRAMAAHETGELTLAAEYLENVPDDYPGAIPALLELSVLYFEPLRRPTQGVLACERILSLNPEIVIAHQRLCHYFAMTLQRDRLIRQVRESVRQRAETVDAYSYFVTLPDLIYGDTLERVENWLEVTPDEPSLIIASALLRTKDDSLKKGNDYEAMMTRELQGLHERFSEDLEILTTLLEIVAREGDVETLGQLLEKSPERSNEDYRMWRIRSQYSLLTGNLDEALRSAEEAIRLYPMDWHSWHHFAGILRRKNKIREADAAQQTAMYGKDLQALLLEMETPRDPPRAVLEGILEYAVLCRDQFVAANLSRRLGRSYDAKSSGRALEMRDKR